MPFIGLRNDRPILPLEVSDSESVRCPRCDGEMRVRAGDKIARHFYHPPDGTPPTNPNCDGESAAHIEMKHIAAEKLLSKHPAAETKIEHTVADGERRADVLVEFPTPEHPLGRGIAVEVQYRHSQKSVLKTTEDYLRDGFSVMWLDERDFDGDSPDFDDVHLTDPLPVWPYAVPNLRSDEPATSSSSPPLDLTEKDVLPYLPDDSIGQHSLAAFTSQEETPGPSSTTEPVDDTPSWSLERSLTLSLSPTDTATKELVSALLEAILQHRAHDGKLEQDVAQYKETAAASDRDCHISEWFRGEDRDGFEIEALLAPDGTPHALTIENRRRGQQFNLPVGDSAGDLLNEFTTAVMIDLLRVSDRTPNSTGTESDWSHVFETGTHFVVCSVQETNDEGIELSLKRVLSRTTEQDTLHVQFTDSDIETLISLCARVRIHEQ